MKYRAMYRVRSFDEMRKQEAECKHSEESSYKQESNKYPGVECAMKVMMKANHPSGLVLEQSGLFVNIFRRELLEHRVPRLSDNPRSSIPFRR